MFRLSTKPIQPHLFHKPQTTSHKSQTLTLTLKDYQQHINQKSQTLTLKEHQLIKNLHGINTFFHNAKLGIKSIDRNKLNQTMLIKMFPKPEKYTKHVHKL